MITATATTTKVAGNRDFRQADDIEMSQGYACLGAQRVGDVIQVTPGQHSAPDGAVPPVRVFLL